ncbi:MAG: DUF3800 domain-containing protein, partial [Candidatus Marinimicrobia bacterium]|nr:DUF3800 domain-containing protein [Candidatus Neomarinimicrobiota bacterium]
MPPKIAFDESGNTGHRLLDPEQPVFVLSSVYFTDDEANELLDILRSPQTKEIKFKNIIKRKSGENLIIDFLKNPIIDNTRVKITVNHKGFFLFSKIVDILLESMLYKLGFDFYKNGLNIAFANLIYLTTPVFCGQSNFLDFQRSFITMIEKQNTESIYHFYSRLENLIANSKNAEFCVTLSIL